MQQASDFLEDSKQLHRLLAPLESADFDKVTLFKGWTINDVLGHLYMFNVAASLTLSDEQAFAKFIQVVEDGLARGEKLVDIQKPWLGNLAGQKLLEAWWENSTELSDLCQNTSPSDRVKWIGPQMSARSCITARQMETWAHGQEVFDILGVERQCFDRIKNIVHLGVITYNWSFINRKITPPDPAPYLRLQSPEGNIWEWNEQQPDNAITGNAVDFAQVVTQTRNIDDTDLICTGPAARQWMELAQCFAGPPSDPPAKGERYIS
ncbi:MAG: TIGR03084 family metal-binding protein [Methyloligellaceae bacterium]